jgi:hypothetical protein
MGRLLRCSFSASPARTASQTTILNATKPKGFRRRYTRSKEFIPAVVYRPRGNNTVRSERSPSTARNNSVRSGARVGVRLPSFDTEALFLVREAAIEAREGAIVIFFDFLEMCRSHGDQSLPKMITTEIQGALAEARLVNVQAPIFAEIAGVKSPWGRLARGPI